jgi:hypothetical protein
MNMRETTKVLLIFLNSDRARFACWAVSLNRRPNLNLPEASTWTVVMVGFLMVGWLAYLRQRSAQLIAS